MAHTITLELPHLLPDNADCACCVNHLVDALHGRAGVVAARLEAADLILDIDPQSSDEAHRLAHEAAHSIERRYDHPTFVIEGMDCAGCADTVERALTRLIGIHFAHVDLAAKQVRLEYDREQTSVEVINAALERFGYTLRNVTELEKPAVSNHLSVARSSNGLATDDGHLATDYGQFVCSVEGMCCAAESGPIERAVRALAGAREVAANPALARLSVAYDPQLLAPARIVAEVERLGFRVTQPITADEQQAVDHNEHSFILRLSSLVKSRPRDLLTAICGALFIAAWLGGYAGLPESATSVLYVLATLVGGVFVARLGWARLRATRVFDINALMTIAAVGALLIGEYAEGAAVVFLFALGNALEGYTMERARRSIRALMRLAPATALVRRAGFERSVPVGEVIAGEVVIVRPGDRLPLDGVIVEGRSQVDQAPITGESMPAAKVPGAEVFAGSINGEGALDVRVSRPAQDSTLARIIHLVEEAQARKSQAQRFIDVFAQRYTPAVLMLALLVATLPPLVAGAAWSEWIYRALVLLVIACPCALVISTPVSIISAISTAARSGVLFKGGAALEATGGLRALAFDKTGTLTIGKPVVTDVFEIADSGGQPAILRLAAAVERRSAHPLARTIVAQAEERGLHILAATDFQAQNGRGATAIVEGRTVKVGDRAMFEDLDLPVHVAERMAELEEAGRTAVLVGVDSAVCGIIAVADQERAESRESITALRRMGIAHVAMLTGDAERIARRIAASVGVDEARAELLPHEKLEAVDQLLARHGSVGMVGDGINDAPALARATVGIAMGGAGSDAALETADVTLMSDDLTKLPFAIGLSRSARRVILQNIVFALAVKAVFLVATLLGVATLWMAVFADTGAALIVIANGMRLLRWRG